MRLHSATTAYHRFFNRLALQYAFIRALTADLAAALRPDFALVRTAGLAFTTGVTRAAGYFFTAAGRGFLACAISIPKISERSPSSSTLAAFGPFPVCDRPLPACVMRS